MTSLSDIPPLLSLQDSRDYHEIIQNTGADESMLQCITSSPTTRCIRRRAVELTLVFDRIDDNRAEKIASQIKNNDELRRIIILIRVIENFISDKGAAAFANLSSLTTLNLSQDRISSVSKFTSTLADNGTLTMLDLSHNKIDSLGAVLLANRMRAITDLNLSDNRVGPQGAFALAQCAILRKLDLSCNPLFDEGLAAFGNNQRLNILVVKSDSSNQYPVGDAGVAGLMRNRILETLGFCFRKISDNAATLIAQNTTLRCLDLTCCSLSDVGINALACSQLTRLNLSCVELSLKGVEAFNMNKTLLELNLRRSFSLQEEEVGEFAASVLSSHPTLTRLDMSENRLTDSAAVALANSQSLRELTLEKNRKSNRNSFEVGENEKSGGIANQGASALAGNKTLTKLRLGGNDIGDSGISALTHNPRLSYLDVRDNAFGDLAAFALGQSSTLITLGVDERMYKRGLSEQGAVAILCNKTFTTIFGNMADRRQAFLNHRIPINRRVARNWQRVAVLISAYRANQFSSIRDSVLPLIPSIMEFMAFDGEMMSTSEYNMVE